MLGAIAGLVDEEFGGDLREFGGISAYMLNAVRDAAKAGIPGSEGGGGGRVGQRQPADDGGAAGFALVTPCVLERSNVLICEHN